MTNHSYGKSKKMSATKVMDRSRTLKAPKKRKLNSKSANSILRLRLLISDLISEVESLDQKSLSLSVGHIMENSDNINFYEEVARFEVALIRSALKRTEGHQNKAAQFLKLNPSTLNAKIKQYKI
jgi:DNA-binding NtrC family response regulator